MTEPLYIARARIEKVRGVHRRAHLESGATIEMGVHGPIVEHYRLSPESEHPLPIDFVVAAAGG